MSRRPAAGACCLLAAVALLASVAWAAAAESAPDPYARASALARKGRLAEAADLLLALPEEQRREDRIHELLVRVLILSGRSPEAERQLRRRLERRPEDARSLQMLGALLEDAGRSAEGAELLESAARIDPLDAGTWLELGRAKLRAGEPDAAVLPLERARRLDPGSPEIRYSLAQAYSGAGRDADAEREIAAYREAQQGKAGRLEDVHLRIAVLRSVALREREISVDPELPAAHYVELAGLYRKGMSLDRGRAFFGSLIEERPDLAGPWLGGCLVAWHAGDRQEGWEMIRAARQRQPLSPAVLGSMTDLADTAERRQEVALILRAIRDLAGAPSRVPVWLAILAAKEGSYGEAETILREALAASPADAEAMRSLGRIYLQTGRRVEAMAIHQRLVEAEPDRGDNWYRLAVLESEIGLAGPARDHLAQALALGEERPPVLNLLARLLAGADPGRAAGLLERSLALDPDQPAQRALLERLRARPGGPAG